MLANVTPIVPLLRAAGTDSAGSVFEGRPHPLMKHKWLALRQYRVQYDTCR